MNIIGIFLSILFQCCVWCIIFKYWQTSNEIKYMFRMLDPIQSGQIKQQYFVINFLGYFFATVPYAARIIVGLSIGWGVVTGILAGVCLIGFVFMVTVLAHAMRRLREQVKVIPALKNNSRNVCLFFAVFSMFIAWALACLIACIVNDSIANLEQFIAIMVFSEFGYALLLDTFVLFICKMALDVHNPNLTRVNTVTGE